MEAVPPEWWDSRTFTMQPQGLGQGNRKVGALYVDCFKVDFILIFGVTWGQIPWCVIKRPTSDFRTNVADNQNSLRLKHIFEQFSETDLSKRPTSAPLTTDNPKENAPSTEEPPHSQFLYWFDSYVPEPNKEIWHCKETGLSIVAETVTAAGRDTHVLRVDETIPDMLKVLSSYRRVFILE